MKRFDRATAELRAAVAHLEALTAAEPQTCLVVLESQGKVAETDLVGVWLRDRTVEAPGVWTRFSDLYADFEQFCRAAGSPVESKTRVGRRLRAEGLLQKSSDGSWWNAIVVVPAMSAGTESRRA